MKKSRRLNQTSRVETPHIVVLGGGFGGLEFCRRMRGANVRVTLIDRQNHHLFQPLLYQVASAGLSAPDIASPLRALLEKQENTSVLMEEVVGIDLRDRCVMTSHRTLGYDYLVIALGAKTSYFGNDHWREHTLELKSLNDATAMRRAVLTAFEQAEGSDDPEEIKRLMTIAVVGGGPTGVELAGAFAELAREVLPGAFQKIDPRDSSILLVEAGPRLLPSFSEEQSEYARRRLEAMGVTVKTDCKVEDVGEDYLEASGERFDASTVVWAAGVEAPGFTRHLGVPVDKGGRLEVEPDLSLPGFSEVFAVGDIARAADADGKPVPGVAPAAMQMGKHAAKIVRDELRADAALKPARGSRAFRYLDKGSMATIGRSSAVAETAGIRFNGPLAWLAWLFIHLLFLVGVRNRLFVLMQWFYAYATYRRGARVITGPKPATAAGERRGREKVNENKLAEPVEVQ